MGDGVNDSIGHIFCAPAQVLRWAAQNPVHSVRICSPTITNSNTWQRCHINNTTYWLSQQTQHRLGVLGGQLSPCKTLHTSRSCIQKTTALRHQKQRLLGTLLDSSASKRAAPNCTTHPKVSLHNSCRHTIEPPPMQQPTPLTPARLQYACLADCRSVPPETACKRWHALHALITCMFMRPASSQLHHT